MSGPSAKASIEPYILSCDTLVAVAGGSSHYTIFSKNSDRPGSECQPLHYAPRTRHPAGSSVQCQYMRLPQASETLAVLGGRPWWLWGFEQGVNEAGVAIGNEAIYTRDPVPEQGLLGMDFVRLGLERGRSAREAKDVITGLLEQYGQGGVAVRGTDRRYHNSYITADPKEAYVLETSGRHWVDKRVTRAAAISNVVTIEDDWDDASAGIQQHARDRGWWTAPPSQKLNFRQAFEDAQLRHETEPRYLASCRFLERPTTTVAAMKGHLRDHFDSGHVNVAYPGRPRTICLHPGDYLSSTAASLVVELRPPEEGPIVAWCSMATPCTGAFIPVVLGAALPEPLTTGTESRMEGSLWWAMRHLQQIVDRNPGQLTPVVQRAWSNWEAELEGSASADPDALASQLGSLVAELMHESGRLIGDLHEVRGEGYRVPPVAPRTSGVLS